MYRRADGAPCHRRGIGNQVERRGVKRLESQTDHECARNGDRSTKTGSSFHDCAKAESYQQELEPAIGSDRRYRALHDFKLTGVDCDVVEKDRRDHNPGDLQQTESNAIKKARRR